MKSISLTNVIMKAHASGESGAIQFCRKDGTPFWGICNYVGYIAPGIQGYNCIYITPNCALCDCNGTWIMES